MISRFMYVTLCYQTLLFSMRVLQSKDYTLTYFKINLVEDNFQRQSYLKTII